MSDNTDNGHIKIPLHECIEEVLEIPVMKRLGYQVNVPYIVGDPGGGKTMMLAAQVKKRGWGFLSFTPGLERVEKFGGIPDLFVSKDDDSLNTKWSVPELIVKIRELNYEFKIEDHKDKKITKEQLSNPEYPATTPIVVLFDDWHLCTASIQQIGFELFTHYSLNGHKIPSNVCFVLAGNASSAAGAKTQLSAIRNRCTMLYTYSSPEYWVKNYALKNDIHKAGVSFFSNDQYTSLFHQPEDTSQQFGSPRSWTSAFEKLKHFEQNNIDPNHLISFIQGDVGSAAASKFMTYYKFYSSINTKEIFETGKWKIPTDSLKLYAFGCAISYEYYNLTTKVIQKNSTEMNKKQKDAELKRLSDIYTGVIKELYNKHNKEIAVLSICNISMIEGDDNRNMLSGTDLVAKLISNDYFDPNIIYDISNSVTKARNVSKSLSK